VVQSCLQQIKTFASSLQMGRKRQKTEDPNEVIIPHGPIQSVYKIFKIPIKTIMNEKYLEPVQNLVMEFNELYFHSYLFIRAFILFHFESKCPLEFPPYFIEFCVKTLCKQWNKDTKWHRHKRLLSNWISKWISKINNHQKMNSTDKAHIITNLVKQITTNIETKILQTLELLCQQNNRSHYW
jgi:hypothetical protein